MLLDRKDLRLYMMEDGDYDALLPRYQCLAMSFIDRGWKWWSRFTNEPRSDTILLVA